MPNYIFECTGSKIKVANNLSTEIFPLPLMTFVNNNYYYFELSFYMIDSAEFTNESKKIQERHSNT